jgi:hypothetical protein
LTHYDAAMDMRKETIRHGFSVESSSAMSAQSSADMELNTTERQARKEAPVGPNGTINWLAMVTGQS